MIPEKELINGLKEGSEAAFRQLVEHHKEIVYNVCWGYVRNDMEAEDLAQEVFIDAYKRIDKFRGDSKLSTWLYRVAVNRSLDHIRYSKRQKRSGNVVSLTRDDDEAPIQLTETGTPDPEAKMEQDEAMSVLLAAIDSLPETQKTALSLHKFEGLPYGEVAVVMKTSLSAVESLIFRAKANLKKKLGLRLKNR